MIILTSRASKLGEFSMYCRTYKVLSQIVAICITVFSVSSLALANQPPAIPSGCTVGKNADKLVEKDKNTYGNVEECTFKADCGPAFKGGSNYPGWASKLIIKDGKVTGEMICVSRNCKGGAWMDIMGTCSPGSASSEQKATAPPTPVSAPSQVAPAPAPATVKKVNCGPVIVKFKNLMKACSKLKVEDKKKGCFENAIGRLSKYETDACAVEIESTLSEMKAEEAHAPEKEKSDGSKVGNDGHHDQGTGASGKGEMKPDNSPEKGNPCEQIVQKAMQKMKPQMESCQKMKDESKRKECHERLHQMMMKDSKLKQCENEMEAMKNNMDQTSH